ncbi:MAG TPA: signal peptidase I [Haliangiales bacterium]|nr:signal peptidase I [Haliangiales bacterium]
MRSLAAIVLSLTTPGACHAFLGRPHRGAVFLGAILAALLTVPWTRVAGLAAALVLYVAAQVDAAFLFHRAEGNSSSSWAIFLGVGLISVVSIRVFYYEAFKIPSGGMIPTLEIGDHIFVAKWRTSPARGEVIVFIWPVDPRKDFVKRVVALAGDRVAVRGGTLFVNGTAATAGEGTPCSYWDYTEDTARWHPERATCVPEMLDGKRYTVAHVGPLDRGDMAEVLVPPGNVFVLGDNRTNSQDSRYWGPLPAGNIKGTLMFIWWSSSLPEGVRWGRVGTVPD